MHAGLAQAVALVAHGNTFLNDPKASPPDLVASNTTFQYAGALEFRLAQRSSWLIQHLRRPRGTFLTKSTVDWFRYAKDTGVKRFWLVGFPRNDPRMPDHIGVAFAGFSYWAILALGNGTAAQWVRFERLLGMPERGFWRRLLRPIPRVRGIPKDLFGKRIWQVVYMGTEDANRGEPVTDLPAARARLSGALDDAIEFTKRADAAWWRELLESARAQLSSPKPRAKYHNDMLPATGYSLEARQLLAAAASAWVFGGMGSWNDMVFEGDLQDDYERITPALYAAVTEGIVAAANAFRPAIV